jgi:hypothetical protein
MSMFDDVFFSEFSLLNPTSPPALYATASYDAFNSADISDFFYPDEVFFFIKISSLHPLVTPAR